MPLLATGAGLNPVLRALYSAHTESGKKYGLAEPSVGLRADDAVIVGLSSTAFRTKLEKHLDDFSKGKGYLSGEVSHEIQTKNFENFNTLQPDQLALYGQYGSFLTYSNKARYVTSVNEASDTANYIEGAPERAEAFTEQVKKLFGYDQEK